MASLEIVQKEQMVASVIASGFNLENKTRRAGSTDTGINYLDEGMEHRSEIQFT